MTLRTAVLPILLVCALGMTACQSSPQALGQVVPIYATQADAQVVARGGFSVVPIALAGEAEIALSPSQPCTGDTVAIQSSAGVQGWAPISSLPQSLQRHCDSGPLR